MLTNTNSSDMIACTIQSQNENGERSIRIQTCLIFHERIAATIRRNRAIKLIQTHQNRQNVKCFVVEDAQVFGIHLMIHEN